MSTLMDRERKWGTWSALLILAGSFMIAARSWVAFFQSFEGADGGQALAFTQTDYPAVVIASRMIVEGRGGRLYDLEAQRAEQERLIEEGSIALPRGDVLRYPYPYTPFIALLMTPFAGTSPMLGWAVWDLINIAAYAGGVWLLLSALSLTTMQRLLMLLGGLTSFPFIVNLEQGQSSGVVVLALGSGLALLKRGNDLPAGLTLGLLAVKIQWLPVLGLVLLWKRRWWALLGTAATALALTLVAVALMGTDWIPGLIDTLLKAQGGSRDLLLDPLASHSLLGALVALFGEGAEGIARAIHLALTLALFALLLYILRGRCDPASAQWDGKMAATLLVAVVTNLHLNTHDLSLLALPAALGLSYISQVERDHRRLYTWYAAMWAAYLIPTYFLEQALTWPLRLTTLSTLLMLGLLLFNLLRRPTEESRREPNVSSTPSLALQ